MSPFASVRGGALVRSVARQNSQGPGTRGTDSWLDDTAKTLVPIYPYCLKYTKSDQLSFRKIIKIVITRCGILWLKCFEFDCSYGSAPDSAGGAYNDPQTPNWIKGFTSKETKKVGKRMGRGKNRGKKEKWEGRRKRRGREQSRRRGTLQMFTQLGFAKAHHQIPLEEKWVWFLARLAPRNLWLPLYYFCKGQR